METIEVLKNVQRIALECMISKKPVHISASVMPEISSLQVFVQNREFYNNSSIVVFRALKK